jgi:sulfatase maturation enzyme AslB (radical SAM superfamily)
MTDATASGAASVLTRPDAPAPFHVMAKPTGAVCNLHCE